MRKQIAQVEEIMRKNAERAAAKRRYNAAHNAEREKEKQRLAEQERMHVFHLGEDVQG